MPLHDYLCLSCEHVMENEFEAPTKCSKCGADDLEITFQNWKMFNRRRDVKSANDLVDDLGNRRAFKASEDPTVRIEMGLQASNGLQTFSPEQAAEYRERLMRDGDTPTLRRKVLRERTENLKRQGIDAPESM